MFSPAEMVEALEAIALLRAELRGVERHNEWLRQEMRKAGITIGALP